MVAKTPGNEEEQGVLDSLSAGVDRCVWRIRYKGDPGSESRFRAAHGNAWRTAPVLDRRSKQPGQGDQGEGRADAGTGAGARPRPLRERRVCRVHRALSVRKFEGWNVRKLEAQDEI